MLSMFLTGHSLDMSLSHAPYCYRVGFFPPSIIIKCRPCNSYALCHICLTFDGMHILSLELENYLTLIYDFLY